ncbi:MAG TPA: hypothetical protein VNF00_02020 [Candidatus Acidoferrales bacterium]|nr:hypothetical protein [Candidatus Acidoferrales bacterium]
MPFDREIIEAKLGLELIEPAEMPKLAWDALEADLDGPAIRRLAALVKPTWFQVREILPNAMQEMGLAPITAGEGARRIARRRAQEILKSGADPLLFADEFGKLWIRTGYPSEISDLGALPDDIHVARLMGESQEKIREWVTERLEDLVYDRPQ